MAGMPVRCHSDHTLRPAGERRAASAGAFLVVLLTTAAPLLGEGHSPAPSQTAVPEPVIQWLEEHATPLSTDDPEAGGPGLEAWVDMIGDARVVGLGEGTHGTREFYRLKHRLFRRLADSAGFDALVWEVDVPSVQMAERMILDPEADLERANLAFRGANWRTTEIVDLFGWLRRQNRDSQGPRLLGIDIFAEAEAFTAARETLRRLDPAGARAYDATAADVLGLSEADLAAPERVAEAIAALTLEQSRRWAEAGALLRHSLVRAGAEWEAELTAATVEQRARHRIQFFTLVPQIGDGPAANVFTEFRTWLGSISGHAEVLRAFLERHDPEQLGRLRGVLDTLASPGEARAAYLNAMTPKQRSAWTQHLAATQARLHVFADAYAARGTAEATDSAKPSLSEAQAAAAALRTTVDRMHEFLRLVPEREIVNAREVALAENLESVLRGLGEEARVALSAHNFHVNRATGPEGGQTSGSLLAQRLGHDYVSVGMLFAEGGFQAADARARRDPSFGPLYRGFDVGPPPQGSLEAALSRVPHEIYVIDLRSLPTGGPVAEWFSRPRPMRWIGNTYDPDAEGRFLYEAIPAEQFDILVFVQRTSRARPTDLAMRQASYDLSEETVRK